MTRAAILAVSALNVTLSMIAPALPALLEHVRATPWAPMMVRLALTAPAIAIAILAMPVGMLIDRLPKRKAVAVSALAFAMLGASGGLWDGLPLLIASRVLLGVAAAFMICGVSALIGDLFEPEARSSFLGMQNASNFALGVAFTLAVGALTDLGWRFAFLPYLLALPAALLALLYLPSDVRWRQHMAPAQHQPSPWGMILLLLALASVAMIFFSLGATQSPFLLKRLHSGSTFDIGVALSSATIAAFPIALLYGRMVRRLGVRLIFLIGFGLIGAGLAIQGSATSLAAAVAGLAITGMGFGAVMPNLSAPLIGLVPAAMRGRISGAMLSAVFLGQFMSPLFSQPLVDAGGLDAAFLILGATAGAVGIAVFTFFLARPLPSILA